MSVALGGAILAALALLVFPPVTPHARRLAARHVLVRHSGEKR